MENLPDHVVLTHLCPFIHLQDRWHNLLQVSKRWYRLTFDSVHQEQHLDLTWCTGEDELDAARALFLDRRRHCSLQTSHLESVALYGSRVTGPFLSQLLHNIGYLQLQHLTIESKQVEDAALEQLKQCTKLQTLALHCIKLTDHALVRISRTCSQLTKVDLSGSSSVRDEGIIAIAVNCQKLETLDVTMCRQLTDRSVLALSHHSSLTLKKVVLDRCLKISGPAIRLLMNSQRKLQSLSFARCPKVQGADFYDMTPLSTAISLSFLDLSGCAGVDDRGVAAVLLLTQFSLQSLNLGTVPNLGSATFRAIAHCRNLAVLNLSHSPTLQNDDLMAIVAGCTQLSTLSLQACVALTAAGFQAIARYSKSLQQLSLEFCFHLTDESFVAVVTNCRQIRHLNVKACNQLTLAAFRALSHARSLPLETVYIGACAKMETTATYFAMLKHSFPHCRIHWV